MHKYDVNLNWDNRTLNVLYVTKADIIIQTYYFIRGISIYEAMCKSLTEVIWPTGHIGADFNCMPIFLLLLLVCISDETMPGGKDKTP